ncbi:MAG: YcaO-like family protein [Desulfosudaceae bacterium]
MKSNFSLQDAFKRFTADQDKVMPPEETVERFKKRAAATGLDILSETRRIDTGRLDIPVYVSICGQDAAMLTGTAKQMGKGASPAQAEASAVMELAERFSFYSFASNPDRFKVDTRENLADEAVSFEVLARSVNDDSANRAAVKPFLDGLPQRWARAHNLTTGQAAWLPFDWFFAINEFNGTCAGNCPEEAICQGICEVVERHVSCLVARQSLPTPAIDPSIDPDSARHPVITDLLDRFQAAGIELYLSDFTLDTGIPTVGALAYDPATFPEKSELVWTAGTAPDPWKALSRTLTEIAQLGGDFNTGGSYVSSGLPKPAGLEEVAFLMNRTKAVSLGSLPDLSDDNIRVEIESCLAALAARDMDVYLIELTDPQLGLPAFYTIIPGARFYQRAENASTAMFTAKLMAETMAPDQAIPALLSLEDSLGPAYYLSFFIGIAQLQAGRPEEALTHLYQALDLSPPDEDAPGVYSYAGVCLKETGRFQEALAVLRKGLAIDSERTDILNLMGFCHFKLGEHRRAIDCFKSILKLDPGSAIDYANIATNYRELGQTEQAVYYYQQALAIDASLDFARDNLEALLSQ